MSILFIVVLSIIWGQVTQNQLEKQKTELTEKFEKEKAENKK